MKACQQIAERIVAGQPLDEEQRAHLEHCQACTALAESQRRLQALAEWHRQLDEPTPSRWREVLEGSTRKRSLRQRGRLVLAATAALLLVALAAWLWLPRGGNGEVDTAGRLWALMEEVDEVVRLPGADEQQDWFETQWSLFAGGEQNANDDAQPENVLPKSWQALEMVLGEIVI